VNDVATSTAFRTADELDRRRAALVAMERLKTVNAEMIRRLRYDLYCGDAVTRDEADALFDIERVVCPASQEWGEFFVGTIVDYLLWQERPSGVLNEAKAEWLVGQVDRTKSLAAFAILVAALEEAHRVPPWFEAAVRGRAARGWPGVEMSQAA
jgi:hypothetical protein